MSRSIVGKTCFKNLSIFSVLFFGGAMIGVGGASAESINTALSNAYQNNPTLNAQRAATRVADEAVPIAKSGLRPTITASANAGLSETTFNGLTTKLTPRGFGVSISQTLWDSNLTRNNVNAANSAVLASREALRNTEQNILFNAASAYLDVLRDRQIVIYNSQSLEFLNEQVRSENARFEVGEATRTDVAQAKASRAAAVAALSVSKASLATSEAIYRQIIGNKPGRLSKVKGVTGLIPKSLGSGMTIAEREHPAIKSTEHLVDQAIYNVKVAESGLLPTLGVTGSATRNFDTSASVSSSVTNNSSVTATLTVPIYQGGRQTGLVRQNKEALGQSRIEVDISVDSVRAAVISAYSQYEAARASVKANEEQLRAANLALEGAVEERKVGQRTTLDVLDTQTVVINAQIALANSRRDLKTAGYAILSSVGRLSARKLGLQVAIYQPVEHFDAVKDKWFGLRIPSGN